jgi:hypothetical protein
MRLFLIELGLRTHPIEWDYLTITLCHSVTLGVKSDTLTSRVATMESYEGVHRVSDDQVSILYCRWQLRTGESS